MVSERLKQVVFKHLYRELGNVEIIPYKDSIWLIDREKEHWYFEFETSGRLWWRYYFFNSFFTIFSLEPKDFEPILASWVEEVLNHKVTTTRNGGMILNFEVEEVLNHKVTTTAVGERLDSTSVEEVLNHKVTTTKFGFYTSGVEVEEVLNHKVSTTTNRHYGLDWKVEEVLNQ